MPGRGVLASIGSLLLLVAVVSGSLLASEPPDTTVTFSKDVAPIFYTQCVSCHRPGEIAPMSLLTYQDARPWARSIRQNVLDRTMPPWHADPQHGTFRNVRRLIEPEIQTIVAWVDGGAREGDARDLPSAPTFGDGWTIGTPDAVFSMPDEFDVPADGVVEYRHFTTPTNFTEDKWIAAAEIRPGNRTLVHHVIVYVQAPPGGTPATPAIKLGPNQATPPRIGPDGKPRPPRRLGMFLVGIAPGTRPLVFTDGYGKRLAAGSTLLFEVHYTPNGTAGKDRTSIGLKFAPAQAARELRTTPVLNGQFVIPAGAANHKVESEATFIEDVRLWSLFPHMHLRGKTFEYRLVYPDGRSEILLSVPKYDFNWQGDYIFTESVLAPKGSRLVCTAYFDNSKGNPFNPDPTQEVRWGDQTWEEMMIGWINYSVERSSSPTAGADRPVGPAR